MNETSKKYPKWNTLNTIVIMFLDHLNCLQMVHDFIILGYPPIQYNNFGCSPKYLNNIYLLWSTTGVLVSPPLILIYFLMATTYFLFSTFLSNLILTKKSVCCPLILIYFLMAPTYFLFSPFLSILILTKKISMLSRCDFPLDLCVMTTLTLIIHWYYNNEMVLW